MLRKLHIQPQDSFTAIPGLYTQPQGILQEPGGCIYSSGGVLQCSEGAYTTLEVFYKNLEVAYTTPEGFRNPEVVYTDSTHVLQCPLGCIIGIGQYYNEASITADRPGELYSLVSLLL